MKGRSGHRPLRIERETFATTWASGAQRSVCASGCEEMGGNCGKDHPQRGHQPRAIPQSRLRRASSLYTREPCPAGDGGSGRRVVGPYEDPEIAVAIVVEQAGAGANITPAAVAILNSWFSAPEIDTPIQGENTLLP